MSHPVPKPGVLDIAAYIPGKSAAPNAARVFKLSANETPLGASPRSGRLVAGAARSHRPHLRARSRPHRLRLRLR